MSPRVLASPMHPSQANPGGSLRHGNMSASSQHSGNSSTHGGGGSTVGKSPRAPPQHHHQQHSKPGTRRNTTWIGKTVRITQGPYKGYVGIVKDATDATARVELHTKCQTISVDIVRITQVEYVNVVLSRQFWNKLNIFVHSKAMPNHSIVHQAVRRLPRHSSLAIKRR